RRLDSRRDGTQQLRDRPRRPRGALALGPRGEQLGVALVQADDSFSEPVGSEDLGPSALALRIDLVEMDPLYLVGAAIERHIIRGAGVHRVTQQGESVTEGRDLLLLIRQAWRSEQRAARGEQS